MEGLQAWGTEFYLDKATVDKIIDEGYVNIEIVKLMGPKHIKGLKLNMGQTLALEYALSKFDTVVVREPTDSESENCDDPKTAVETVTQKPTSELTELLAACKTGDLAGAAKLSKSPGKPLLVQDHCSRISSYRSMQEREVLSLGGDERLMMVSNTRKITPEATTLPQWIKGHLKIQDLLIQNGELGNMDSVSGYARYGQKIADMAATYPVPRVMRFDYEYRMKVFEGELQWGEADPELMNFCVFTHYVEQQSSYTSDRQARPVRKRDHMTTDPASGREICRNFNIQKGCVRRDCRFAHVCAKCFQGHPEHKHA